MYCTVNSIFSIYSVRMSKKTFRLLCFLYIPFNTYCMNVLYVHCSITVKYFWKNNSIWVVAAKSLLPFFEFWKCMDASRRFDDDDLRRRSRRQRWWQEHPQGQSPLIFIVSFSRSLLKVRASSFGAKGGLFAFDEVPWKLQETFELLRAEPSSTGVKRSAVRRSGAQRSKVEWM